MKLVQDENIGQALAIRATNTSKGQLYRGLKSRSAGRQIAVNGRPPIFDSTVNQLYGQKLKERLAQDKKITIPVAQAIVLIIFLFVYFFAAMIFVFH